MMALPATICSPSYLPKLKPPRIPSVSSVSNPSSIVSLLGCCSNVGEFSPIHAQLITTNLIKDPQIAIQVLRFFLSIKDPDYGLRILSQTYKTVTKIWNFLMEDKLRNGASHEVLVIYSYMVNWGVELDLSTLNSLIRACSRVVDFRQGSEVHARILKFGASRNTGLNNNLMGMYAKCGKLAEVCQLFEKLPQRDVISWNTMISCYVQLAMYSKALKCFEEMMLDGIVPVEITMISLVSACVKLRDLEMGRRLHLYIEDGNIEIGGSLLNCLVDLYVKCGEIDKAHGLLERYKSDGSVVLCTTLISGYVKLNEIEVARQIFEQMTERDLITWSTMFSGYAQCGRYYESLKLFRQMRVEDVWPDEVVLVKVLSACAHVEDSELGEAVHGLIAKHGMIVGGFLGNALIYMYAKCCKLDKAYTIFEQFPCKSVVTWNSVLDGFCRSGDIEKARAFFNQIPEKSVVSWNTMINLYAKHDKLKESFELFHEMQNSTVKPDKLTLSSLLSSCASAGVLNHGIWVHTYIKRNQFVVDYLLGTALIDMYGKCGNIDMASQLFSKMAEKNVFAWTAMIVAYAMDGQAQNAFDLFMEMEESGVKPDNITFIALLSACSHGGLIDEGYKYLNKMRTFYNLTPKIQHYGCMVDLLGRVGHLEEAAKFIESMPINPDVSIWTSLLRACGSHKNVELAEYAFKQLVEIDPLNAAAYIQLSNIYANEERWDEVSKMRKALHDMGVRKQPGCSMIEQNGEVYKFAAEDFSNPESAEIYSLLDDIQRRLPNQEIQESSSHHSERLAVAFGLISSTGKTPIRVVNNVRICGDCHTAMKLISQAYDREIVIRDNYRFHRFQNGRCSCNDFW